MTSFKESTSGPLVCEELFIRPDKPQLPPLLSLHFMSSSHDIMPSRDGLPESTRK